MTEDAYLDFLVQDVILTLGTVRGALGWLGDEDACPPTQRAAGCRRIARQIDAIEDRARDLWGRLQARPARAAATEESDIVNLFDVAEDEGRDRVEMPAIPIRRACA